MKKRLRFTLAVCALALSISGCGSNDGEAVADNSAGGDVSQSTNAEGTTALKQKSCSGFQTKLDGNNDVLGVTLGMAADVAYQTISCANPAFSVSFDDGEGFNVPAMPNGEAPRSAIIADAGSDKVKIYLAGERGREQVVSITRSTEFSADQLPPFDTVIDGLKKKYGPLYWKNLYPAEPQRKRDLERYALLKSADDKLLTPDNSDWDHCDRGGALRANEDCGLTVHLDLKRANSNIDLASSMYLELVNQRQAYRAVDAYQTFAQSAATEQRKADLDAAHAEAEKAKSDGGSMPDL